MNWSRSVSYLGLSCTCITGLWCSSLGSGLQRSVPGPTSMPSFFYMVVHRDRLCTPRSVLRLLWILPWPWKIHPCHPVSSLTSNPFSLALDAAITVSSISCSFLAFSCAFSSSKASFFFRDAAHATSAACSGSSFKRAEPEELVEEATNLPPVTEPCLPLFLRRSTETSEMLSPGSRSSSLSSSFFPPVHLWSISQYVGQTCWCLLI